jgi:bifunctional DNA-binding transcriptional regulator/antitoxin component of YhaV-PrlF toxin-antitoxin module
MDDVEIKKVDAQGRVSLPANWRKMFLVDTNEVMIIKVDEKLEIMPTNADLSKYIDMIEVDIEEWKDYHLLRKELRRS